MSLKVMTQDGKATQLVNTGDPDATIRITHERTHLRVNGVKLPGFRINALYAHPVQVTQPGCADGCAPMSEATDLVRVQVSGLTSRKAEVITLLQNYVDLLKDDSVSNLWEGFPVGQTEIVFPVVGE